MWIYPKDENAAKDVMFIWNICKIITGSHKPRDERLRIWASCISLSFERGKKILSYRALQAEVFQYFWVLSVAIQCFFFFFLFIGEELGHKICHVDWQKTKQKNHRFETS